MVFIVEHPFSGGQGGVIDIESAPTVGAGQGTAGFLIGGWWNLVSKAVTIARCRDASGDHHPTPTSVSGLCLEFQDWTIGIDQQRVLHPPLELRVGRVRALQSVPYSPFPGPYRNTSGAQSRKDTALRKSFAAARVLLELALAQTQENIRGNGAAP